MGGEIEDQVSVQVQRGYQQISPPSLHETHFESDLDDIDLPSCRTVLHHPDPFVSTTNHRRAGQRPSYAGKYTHKINQILTLFLNGMGSNISLVVEF